MGKAHNPRHGSMQFWPRKKAKRAYPRVRSWNAMESKEASPLGFCGYKVGMTHVVAIDNRAKSPSKGQEIALPCTVIECPPIKIASARFFSKTPYGLKVEKEIDFKTDKELKRKKVTGKTNEADLEKIDPEAYAEIRITAYTQPKLTGIGKKKPEIFELGFGGKNADILAYIKENHNKEIKVSDVLKQGQLIDTLAVTTGKGFQGPVKRFGVSIRSHKSEKTIRGPGSLGGWKGHAHFMYRNAQAGQTGYQTRLDYNKWILKISEKTDEVNPKGGFVRYGNVKNEYVLIKGSVPGASKRLIRLNFAQRGNKNMPKEAPSIVYTSLESKQ
jgi:large subunit ribosomal protein L3